MAKRLLTYAFVFVAFYAAYLYSNRNEKTLRENMLSRDEARPRLEIESISIYRYKGDDLVGRTYAKTGHFEDPNAAEFFGDFKAIQYKKDQVHWAASEKAKAFFDTDSLKGILEGAPLKVGRLDYNVKIQYTDYLLLTESAEYTPEDNVFKGSEPVEIRGANRTFEGDKGFRLELDTEMLELYGNVKGENKGED